MIDKVYIKLLYETVIMLESILIRPVKIAFMFNKAKKVNDTFLIISTHATPGPAAVDLL